VFIPEARAYLVPAPDQLSAQFEGQNVATDGLMALYMRCVHLGCRVPWCAPSQGFECPCHGSRYNAVGEYFGGPAPRNLDRFVVENRSGNLVIRTGTIIETPRAPELSVQYPQGPSCISAVAASPEA
jgi:cytochrome b6-f complex iron-sulfur subunit